MSTHAFHSSSDTPATLDEALARIDDRARRANDAFERVRDFAAALDAVRGRGESQGVGVVVNHLGLLLQVTFPDSLRDRTPSALSAATAAALRAALADALRQVGEQAREAWGDDPLATQVIEETRDRFSAVTR